MEPRETGQGCSNEQRRVHGWSRQRVLIFVFVALTAVLSFIDPVVENWSQTQWEDYLFFEHTRRALQEPGAILWAESYWTGLFRPLSTNLFYYAGARAFDNSLSFYHAALLVVHGVNAWLTYRLCDTLLGFRAAVIAVFLFVTRVANTESLLYTTQMQTLLPVSFALAAMLAFSKGYSERRPSHCLVSAFCVFAALLSKEWAVVVPFLCLLTVPLSKRDAPFDFRRDVVLMTIPLAGLAVWALWASSHPRIVDPPHWSYDFAPGRILGRYAAYAVTFINAAVAPVGYVYPATYVSRLAWYDSVASSLAARVLVGVTFTLGAVCLCIPRNIAGRFLGDSRSGRALASLRKTALGTSFFAISLLPMVILEHRVLLYYGYPGHIGLAMACGAVADASLDWWQRSHAFDRVRAVVQRTMEGRPSERPR